MLRLTQYDCKNHWRPTWCDTFGSIMFEYENAVAESKNFSHDSFLEIDNFCLAKRWFKASPLVQEK